MLPYDHPTLKDARAKIAWLIAWNTFHTFEWEDIYWAWGATRMSPQIYAELHQLVHDASMKMPKPVPVPTLWRRNYGSRQVVFDTNHHGWAATHLPQPATLAAVVTEEAAQ